MQAWPGPRGQCIFCAFKAIRKATLRTYHASRPFQRAPVPQRYTLRPTNRKVDGSDPVALRDLLKRKDAKRAQLRDKTGGKNILDSTRKALDSVEWADGARRAKWLAFKDKILSALPQSDDKSPDNTFFDPETLKASLQLVYDTKKGVSGLVTTLRNQFLDEVVSVQDIQGKGLADLRYPYEWYPRARALQRTIHLHIGPTNSGKTYHALKRLEEAKNGYYAGPLRLLAHEVYSRFNAKGIPCGLVTGDEVRVDTEQEPKVFAHTVEMAPVGHAVEVAVIDEIQMLGDQSRGWAWTRALLGARAQEVHLCGEARVTSLVRELAAAVGDKLVIHRYERLNPLRAMSTTLKGSLKNLRKGDAVICFSRIGIHAMKREIEISTGRRCAIVYGSLPPETRAQQAELFNDPNNDFDYLVASDAVGMGLNLTIKRIVFETVHKRSDNGFAKLSISQLKQIAGRAGRFRAARQVSLDVEQNPDSSKVQGAAPGPTRQTWGSSRSNLKTPSAQTRDNETVDSAETVGLVTCLNDVDLPYIQEALKSEDEPIPAAGLEAPTHIVERFASYFPPGVPFSYIMHRLNSLATLQPRYFISRNKDSAVIADSIEDIKGLDVTDRHIFTGSPVGASDDRMVGVLRGLAKCVAGQSSGSLADIEEIPLEVLDESVSGNLNYVHDLELLHKSLILYLWLSYRFGGVFIDRAMATHAKELAEEKIDRSLLEFSANTKLRKSLLRLKQRRAEELMKKEALFEKSEALGSAQSEQVATEDEVSEATSLPDDTVALPVDWTSGVGEASITSIVESAEADEARVESSSP